ncbi:MAG: quinolinate synthase NadA [Kiritimatiellae bacterium]|nr:quinolinate synthase NadA [Kiritimatiellia bacterium]
MQTIKKEINELKKLRNAVILAHNYERSEVQDIADFTGDSLELARKAATIEADVIVFCGVYFMAETAAILNPTKKVLIPNPESGCAMADMINGAQLRELKNEHPNACAVCYVNSTAEVKAECDMCVTSGNAEKVMKDFAKGREIIFVPDQHLGSHISEKLGSKYILWQGYCPVHAKLKAEKISAARKAHPNAIVMVHPECCKEVRDAADEILSTGAMCTFVKKSDAKEFIVGTEIGILHRLENENPDKKFYPVSDDIVCPDMKRTTLESIRNSLKTMTTVVTVPEEISVRAKRAIDAMLSLS